MTRRFLAPLLILIAAALIVPQVPVFSSALVTTPAHAQESKRKTLFDVLFKRRKKKRQRATKKLRPAQGLPGVKATQKRKKVRTVKKSTRKRTLATASAPATILVKNENAAKLLVVGDFLGSGLASGLERVYAENKDVVVINAAQANSGLVRDDVRNWPAELPELIEKYKPIAVLILAGMNDRQPIRLSTASYEKLSDGWKSEYQGRINSIIKSGISAQVPIVWMGLPPVRSTVMNNDYLAFNEMYRNATAQVNGTFVDVWDGFTNAEGKFVSAGPDINGRIVRLRGAKGINMTRSGRKKLAYFADKALKRLGIVGNPEGFNYASLGTINTNLAQPGVPEYDPAGTGRTIVIPLASPSLDGGAELEGEADFLKAEGQEVSVGFSLVEKGQTSKPTPGRIDAGWGLHTVVEEEKPSKALNANEADKKDEEARVTIDAPTLEQAAVRIE